jgi:hypothetical protein
MADNHSEVILPPARVRTILHRAEHGELSEIGLFRQFGLTFPDGRLFTQVVPANKSTDLRGSMSTLVAEGLIERFWRTGGISIFGF